MTEPWGIPFDIFSELHIEPLLLQFAFIITEVQASSQASDNKPEANFQKEFE